jgi:hypothetical protein
MRRSWHTNAIPNKTSMYPIISKGTGKGPYNCVLIDPIQSTTPGFVGQMKGFLTNQRYKCATIFVDHFSSLSYIHIQKSTGGEETLQAKKEFETYCATHGIKIKNYHADNGCFAENLSRKSDR